jgi:hypothetical protein
LLLWGLCKLVFRRDAGERVEGIRVRKPLGVMGCRIWDIIWDG